MAFLRRKQTSAGPVWYVGWREGGRGSPVRYLRVGPDRREALRQRTRIEARLLDQRTGGPVASKITFGQFAGEWMGGRAAFVRPTTLALERHLLTAHLRPAFGARALAGITAHDAATWAGKLAPRRSATARRAWQLLSTILEAAGRAGHLGANPLRGVPGPKAGPRRRAVPSVEDVCRLLEATPQRWRTVLLTFALTGLRWGELAALRPEDVTFDGGAYGAGRISVRRNRPAGRREEGEPKSQAGWRAIDLVPPLRAALLDHAARGGRVFTGARGGPLDHRTFARTVWIPTLEAAGLLGLHLHDLRHFFASLLVAWGESPLYVAGQMGHASPAITLAVYGHLLRDGRRLDREDTLRQIGGSDFGARAIMPETSLAGRRSLTYGSPGSMTWPPQMPHVQTRVVPSSEGSMLTPQFRQRR